MIMPIDVDFLKEVHEASTKDSLVQNEKQYVDKDKFKIEDNLLYFEARLYISERPLWIHIIQSRHYFCTTWHFGFNWTFEFIS